MLTRRSLLANAASVAAVGAISPALMSQALAQTVAPAAIDPEKAAKLAERDRFIAEYERGVAPSA